jgi:sn-glycerol 3-phosphate transport system substrate-binding protein
MRILLLALCSIFAAASVAQEVVLRHTLGGAQLDTLATVVLGFNDAQKGKGKVILQSANPREGEQAKAHLGILDASDGEASFGPGAIFVPLHQVMKEQQQPFPTTSFYLQMAGAVEDSQRRLQALPLGLNYPVLFLNRAHLAKTGKTSPPLLRNWVDLQDLAGDLRASGSTCPLTSSNFSWVHIENLAAQHGQPILPPHPKLRNTEVVKVNGLVNVKHLALLATWQQSKYFNYYGADREANARFLSGECAMLTGESSLYAEITRRGLDVAVAPLPHYDDMSEAKPHNHLPDGHSLWVVAGNKKAENQLISKFVRYLLLANVQRDWVTGTAFLPMTSAGLSALKSSPSIPASQKDALIRRLSTPKKAGERLRAGSTREQMRAILSEELHRVWSEKHPAKQALDVAAERGNSKVSATLSK